MLPKEMELNERFGHALTWLLDASRNKAGKAEWLSALLVMAFRAIYCRGDDRRGPWPTRVDRNSGTDIWVAISNFYSTVEPAGHPHAVQSLIGMALGVGDETVNAWLPYLEHIDIDQDEQQPFARWFSDQLDDLEAWDRYYGGGNTMVAPPELSSLLICLAGGGPGKTVLNPACGVGGLLAAAAEVISHPESVDHPRLLAFERNGNASAIAQLRMHLLGIPVEGWAAETGKSLWRAEPEPADIVVSVPPAGVLYERDEFGLIDHWCSFPSRLQAELVITMLALDRLATDGWAALLIPKGFLFRGGEFARLRRIIVESGYVSAVISLPAGLLAPMTHIGTAILVLSKHEHTDTPVMMVDAREIGLRKRRRVFLTDADTNAIVESVRQHKPASDRLMTRPVTKEEIEAADWDLQPERHICRESARNAPSLEERTNIVLEMEREYRSLATSTETMIDELMIRH